MSYGADFPTLYPGDLGEGKGSGKESLFETIQRENQRLKEENSFLKQCVLLTKQNADLKTANVLANILTLLDDKVAAPWDRINYRCANCRMVCPLQPPFFDEQQSVTSSSRPRPDDHQRGVPTQSYRSDGEPLLPPAPPPRSGEHEVPVGNLQTSFKPVVPERPAILMPVGTARPVLQQDDVEHNGILSTNTPAQYHPNGRESLESEHVSVQNRSFQREQENQSRASSAEKGYVSGSRNVSGTEERGSEQLRSSYQSTNGQTPRKETSAEGATLRNNQTRQSLGAENDTWEQMEAGRQVDTANDNPFPAYEDNRVKTVSPEKQGYNEEYQVTTRKRYTSITKENVGSPVATSTPNRNSDVRYNNIINRPVDKIIGVEPIVTEFHLTKLSKIRKNTRLIGEIAFQLDRRILEYIFAWKDMEQSSNQQRKRRYYGYSISNVGIMIRKEATMPNGEVDRRKELELRYRFNYVLRALEKFGYNLELHGEFSQDMVNKYGLMSGPPDESTARKFGLDDPIVLRLLVSQLIENQTELANVLVLLDCLCLLSYDDQRPIFMW